MKYIVWKKLLKMLIPMKVRVHLFLVLSHCKNVKLRAWVHCQNVSLLATFNTLEKMCFLHLLYKVSFLWYEKWFCVLDYTVQMWFCVLDCTVQMWFCVLDCTVQMWFLCLITLFKCNSLYLITVSKCGSVCLITLFKCGSVCLIALYKCGSVCLIALYKCGFCAWLHCINVVSVLNYTVQMWFLCLIIR